MPDPAEDRGTLSRAALQLRERVSRRDHASPALRARQSSSSTGSIVTAARREALLDLEVEFARKPGVHRVDVGQNITNAVVSGGGRLSRLRRSNARNMHLLMGGIYGDLVYHHGAGSRHASFWTSFDTNADEAVRIALRDAAFEDLDGLIDFLTGNGPLEEPSDAGVRPRGGR